MPKEPKPMYYKDPERETRVGRFRFRMSKYAFRLACWLIPSPYYRTRMIQGQAMATDLAKVEIIGQRKLNGMHFSFRPYPKDLPPNRTKYTEADLPDLIGKQFDIGTQKVVD